MLRLRGSRDPVTTSLVNLALPLGEPGHPSQANRSPPRQELPIVSEGSAPHGSESDRDFVLITGIEGDKIRVARLIERRARNNGQRDANEIAYTRRLRDYILGVMCDLQYKGEMEAKLRSLQPAMILPPTPRMWSWSDLRGLIHETVLSNISEFVESELIGGGWKPDRGARIQTHGVNYHCRKYVSNFRRAARQAEKYLEYELQVGSGQDSYDLDVMQWAYFNNPTEQAIIDNDMIERILQSVRGTSMPRVVYLLMEGLTQREIARELGISIATLERNLRQFRSDLKKMMEGWDK
jgi:hypothetical protein